MEILVPLYGTIRLEPAVASLVQRPIVQRLRHVRLSNIDSVDLPGIAGVSRFEHSLGVMCLANVVAERLRLPVRDRLVLQAAALLHDASITPFGHLIEEAFRYNAQFDHEVRLQQVFHGEEDVGGVHFQVLGRENDLANWIGRYLGDDVLNATTRIFEAINGTGRFGPLIAGDLDLDNLDNVTRVAFHMGLACDQSLPSSIAREIIAIEDDGTVVVSTGARSYIEEWLHLRGEVYGHLMLSRSDFAMKVMLIHAAVLTISEGGLSPSDWVLTDDEFIHYVGSRGPTRSREAIARWRAGDLYELANLLWIRSPFPPHTGIAAFARELEQVLDRECFAYGIPDKTSRIVTLHLDNGKAQQLGERPHRWLLGVASPAKRPFGREEHNQISEIAAARFGAVQDVLCDNEGPKQPDLWA